MQKVKVGDKVRILSVDAITATWQPKLLKSEQVVTGFNDDGDPLFAWAVPNPEDCPFERRDSDTMTIDSEYGWTFELVE